MDASCQHATDLVSTETQVACLQDSVAVQAKPYLDAQPAQTDIMLKKPCNCDRCCQFHEGESIFNTKQFECTCEKDIIVPVNYCYLVPLVAGLILAVSVFGAATTDQRQLMEEIAVY